MSFQPSKRTVSKLVAALGLFGASAAAFAATDCCGDLQCCMEMLACCFQ